VAGGYRLAAAKVHSPHIVVFVEFGAGHARVKLVIIVFATGFDAMTGPLKALNLKAAGAVHSTQYRHSPRTLAAHQSAGKYRTANAVAAARPGRIEYRHVAGDNHSESVAIHSWSKTARFR
jgi:hypothetical protein